MQPNLLCYHSTIRIHKIKYKGERIVIVIKIDLSGPYSIFVYPYRIKTGDSVLMMSDELPHIYC
jgi:hypothetical protein